MGRMLKLMVALVFTAVMTSTSMAATYKYFAIQLLEGWSEFVPQKMNKKGEYITVFTNASQDTAITITAFANPTPLTEQQMLGEAQKVVNRLQKRGINFTNGGYDQQQKVFAAAGVQASNNQQWRVVMTQEGQVLYTVLFNGTDVDGASRILNTLQALPN